MRRLLAVLLLMALAAPAMAQSNVIVNYKSNSTLGTQVSPTNPLPVTTATSDTTSSGTITATGIANGVVIATNGRSTVGIDVSTSFSGSMLVACSVDYAIVGAANAHWGVTTSIVVTTGAIANAITTTGQYQVNAGGFSACTIYAVSLVSGTPVIAMLASNGTSTVMADNPFPVVQSGTWTMQPGNTPNTAAWLMQLAGQSFTNITTNTDTVVKNTAGTFAGLSVNTAGTASTAVVYNNTTCTGSKIGTFSTVVQGAIAPISVAATVGICVTTAGAGAADITVFWR